MARIKTMQNDGLNVDADQQESRGRITGLAAIARNQLEAGEIYETVAHVDQSSENRE